MSNGEHHRQEMCYKGRMDPIPGDGVYNLERIEIGSNRRVINSHFKASIRGDRNNSIISTDHYSSIFGGSCSKIIAADHSYVITGNDSDAIVDGPAHITIGDNCRVVTAPTTYPISNNNVFEIDAGKNSIVYIHMNLAIQETPTLLRGDIGTVFIMLKIPRTRVEGDLRYDCDVCVVGKDINPKQWYIYSAWDSEFKNVNNDGGVEYAYEIFKIMEYEEYPHEDDEDDKNE
jgi:hypothetical protein